MIIVKLTGGLGNQLFQYAIGRNLSLKNNDELVLDISEFNDTKRQLRNYDLSFFSINGRTQSEADKLTDDFKIIKERAEFIFDPQIYSNKGNIFLKGYWQNEKYFSEIKNILENDLVLKKEYQFDISKRTDGAIEGENTVAVHIRRGDYVKNKNIKKIFDVCDIEYYISAINKMSELVENPTFLFFSDDIVWVKDNIKINHPSFFVSGNKSYEDFVIMQKCKHNIICNSSFSWWAAWLNTNQNKKVIAPAKWLNDQNIDYSDLIPSRWIKIDNKNKEYIFGKNMLKLKWILNIFR